MLMKILGAVDLIVGLFFIFASNFNVGSSILIFFGIILLAKSSLGMLQDFASWTDFLSGVSLLLMIVFPIPSFILFILGLLLLQKGFFSIV